MPNWSEVLLEVKTFSEIKTREARSAVDLIRRQYLKKLSEHTGRNVIAYYSGWLSKPDVLQTDINDEDKNGFMMAVHNMDRSKGLDLILHTPGGSIAATQSISDYLHRMFKRDIRAVIPQIAMSAGTMLACSCSRILMAKHSNLGPIDPHLSGVPAYGVIQEFKQACKEIKADPSKADVWHSIIGQYRPTFLGRCANAIKWSNAFVRAELKAGMLSGQKDPDKAAQRIVKKLTDYTGNRTHGRHIHLDECKAMGLVVEDLEADSTLQDLVLTVHHCYMHSLMNTPAFKMIENQMGVALVKQQQVQIVQA